MMSSRKISKRAKGIVVTAIIAAAVLGAGFASAKAYVSSHFVRGTTINGIDVSGKGIGSLKKLIAGYRLQITEREGNGKADAQKTFTEFISGSDIGLRLGSEDPLHSIIKEQSVWSVITGAEQGFEISDCLTYDENALIRQVKELKCLDQEYVTAPVNATLAGYDKSTGKYEAEKEKPGNTLDEQASIAAVKQAVNALSQKLDLAEKDCYVKPEITAESKEITDILDSLNQYVATEITYEFGEAKEVLNGDIIHKWIEADLDGNINVDKSKVKNFVAGLRQKYDTIFRNREFETAYGTVVKVEGGDYGWWMNYEQEEKKLLKLIKKGKKMKRIPEYYQKAKEYGKQDYGKNYVEVDLTKQHVFVIKKGKVVFDTPCVTGNESRGYSTPQGVYSVTYKQLKATLNGEGYSTPVDYWMPFNGGIGMHDAGWRGSFGGTIYKYSGSHGCVNLKPSAAKKIYGMIEKGTPVICYYSNHIIRDKADVKGAEKPKSKVTEKPKTTENTKNKVTETTEKPKSKVTEKPKSKATEKLKASAKPKAKKPEKTAKATKKPKTAEKTEKTKKTKKSKKTDKSKKTKKNKKADKSKTSKKKSKKAKRDKGKVVVKITAGEGTAEDSNRE